MKWVESDWICPKCHRYMPWSNWGICPYCREKTKLQCKIKFAQVINLISAGVGHELSGEAIVELDDLIDIDLGELRPAPTNNDIERLMALMAEGTRSIEAIKYHRSITGMELKESKAVVERYWVDRTKSNLDD